MVSMLSVKSILSSAFHKRTTLLKSICCVVEVLEKLCMSLLQGGRLGRKGNKSYVIIDVPAI